MTGRLQLSLACWDYDRTAALLDGRVEPDGIDLVPVTLPVEQTFFRMLRHREFDVAEMSLSSYVLSLFDADPPFVAIPVFPSRAFRHGAIYVPQASEVRDPSELAGRLVGVPEYQMSAAVWIRGTLAEHHGLPVESVRYRTGGLHDPGRTEKLPLSLPAEIDVAPIDRGESLAGLLAAGAIDALHTARAPRGFDGSDDGPIRRLFGDHRAVERGYFDATGIFPIMHTVVIRRDRYERHPWIARSLTEAFTEAKRTAMEALGEVTALKVTLPWLAAELEATTGLMGADFWPYGIAANRHTLEVFLRYSHEQGLARRPMEPDELFAPEALDDVHV